MTVLVVEHDPDGNITGWGYKADDDYTPKIGRNSRQDRPSDVAEEKGRHVC